MPRNFKESPSYMGRNSMAEVRALVEETIYGE